MLAFLTYKLRHLLKFWLLNSLKFDLKFLRIFFLLIFLNVKFPPAEKAKKDKLHPWIIGGAREQLRGKK